MVHMNVSIYGEWANQADFIQRLKNQTTFNINKVVSQQNYIQIDDIDLQLTQGESADIVYTHQKVVLMDWHGFPKSITLIEEYGHIGHAAILHGCTIGKNVLVGMNSVILDEAEIGENTIIGANSTVKAKAVIPANVLALGSPAKVVRDLLEKEIEWKRNGTNEYIHLTQRCISSLREVEPLISLENRLDFTNFKAEHMLY